MSHQGSSSDRVREMKHAFDEIFAKPHAELHEQSEDLLAIRVAGDLFAIRLAEVSGLVNNKKIVPLPGSIPELLGVAGVRGELLSVYSMAALLGYNREMETTPWLVLYGTEDPIALAISSFEGHLRLPLPHIRSTDPDEGGRKHITNIAQANGHAHSVISLPSLVGAILGYISRDHSLKES